MNIVVAWREPWNDVLTSNLFFRTHVVRPFGALLYVSLFETFGFDPTPFRIVCYIGLWLNVVIMFFFARILTGRYDVALLLTFLHCHHAGYWPFYYGSGNCYDLFAFTFYFAALTLYLRIRSQARFPRWYELTTLVVLYACAVNSKEAAASLPAILLIYELLFHPPRQLSWLWREARGVVATGIVGLIFIWSRFTSPNVMIDHPLYTPVFTLRRYLESTAVYWNDLSSQPHLWTPGGVACLLVGMLLVALGLRSRILLFAVALIVIGAAPVAFITPRGLACYYIPVLGYALFVAVLLSSTARYLAGRVPKIPLLAWQALIFLGLFSLVAPYETKYGTVHREEYWEEWRFVQFTASEFASHPEWFGPGKSLLVLDDGFKKYPWASTFLAYLVGREKTMQVHKLANLNPRPSTEAIAAYANIITLQDGSYRKVTPAEVSSY